MADANNGVPPLSPEQEVERIFGEKSYYGILNCVQGDDSATIRRNYVKLARKIHPDKLKTCKNATEAFQKVAVAYNVLSDPDKRTRYDFLGSSHYNGDNSINPDQLLSDVLKKIYKDFLDGDYKTVLSFVDAVNSAADANPENNVPKIDLNTVKANLDILRNYLDNVGQLTSELREPINRFAETYETFRSLGYLQIFARVQVGVELLHILCRIPLEVNTMKLPRILNTVLSYTSSGLTYTQSLIGSHPDVTPSGQSENGTNNEETQQEKE